MKKIIILALVIRLISVFIFRNIDNFDLQSYKKTGILTLNKVNIYPKPANINHPYLPFYLYIEALSIKVQNLTSIPYNVFLKSLNTLFDIGIVYLVYLLTNKNLKKTFIYAINPVSVLVFTLHGQFDAIPIFFLLISLYFLKRSNTLFALISFSFSILTKTWPLLFLIFFLKRLKNKWKILLIFLFPIIFILIYISYYKCNFMNILSTLIRYQGLFGIWGVSQILSIFFKRILLQKMFTFSFLGIFFIYSFVENRKDMLKELLLILIFFYIITPGFSIQYLVWIVPFIIITQKESVFSYMILISLYLLLFYLPWIVKINSNNLIKMLETVQIIFGFIVWLKFIHMWHIKRKTT